MKEPHMNDIITALEVSRLTGHPRRLYPEEVLVLLGGVGYDVREAEWPEPQVVLANGDRYEPHPDHGVLIVNGKPLFSAAWL